MILAEALFTGAVIFVVVIGVIIDGAEEFDKSFAFLFVEQFREAGVDGFFFGFEAVGFDGVVE